MKNKKILFIVSIICIIIIAISITISIIQKDNANDKEEEIKINTSETLHKEKRFKNLRIFDISFTHQNGVTRFTANLENQGNEDFEAEDIEIIFKNEDGAEYTIIEGYIVDIPAGAINMIDASITEDKLNAYDFEIIEKADKSSLYFRTASLY